MALENNISTKKYKIIFTDDKFPILYEILKKYDLENLDEKSLENLDEKNIISSPSITLLEIVNDVTEGSLDIKNIPKLLKNELNFSDKDADALSEDIKTKLIPICKKVSIENLATAIPAKPINETSNITNKSIIEEEEVIPPPKKNKNEKNTINPKKNPKDSDSYREPIE
ncbi:MAG: hypothetical protein AAB529_00895 [Patescibacteria group bacterium]